MTGRWPIAPDATPEDVVAVAREEGWRTGGVEEATGDAPFQVVWTTPDGATAVRYVEDTMLGVRYIAADGPSDAVAARLRERGVTYSADEIAAIAESAQTPQQRLIAAAFAGAAAPGAPTPVLLPAIERALDDTEPEVRRVGAIASAYAGWRELLPRLEQMARDDPDAEARALAARVAESLHPPNGEEPTT